ncbi:unnamed protein product, partial [Porites lobata]
VKVERFDFSDPQGGKGEADRQAATIKGHINVYLNEGHDVNNAAQMKEAIESNGGIPGVIVKYVKPPELSAGKNVIKWDGIKKEEVSGLFTCSEDGCIQTFQRSSSLQAHLDEGKHKRALEKETLFDKARKGYAARITGEQTKVPTFGFYTTSKISVDKLHSTLEMGWALKTTRSRTQFTEEQRKFLAEQFLIGEECGKKADPQQVSQEMRRVRDEKAARIFSGKDILSPQQVAGFFS